MKIYLIILPLEREDEGGSGQDVLPLTPALSREGRGR